MRPWLPACLPTGSSDDACYDVKVDPSDGTVWAVGSFTSTASAGSYSLTSAGGTDILVAKVPARPPSHSLAHPPPI